MQRLSISSVLIPSLLALMLISGCSRDGSQPAASGSVVHFGVGTADVQTKTSYGDLGSDKKTVIKWSSGDSIRIYSQQAVHASESSQHWADYVVSSATGTEAVIENAGGGNGLVWGSGIHQFYGIYPATLANDSISIDNNTITAGIPKTQKYTKKNDSTFTPDMKYAFMFAGVQVNGPQNEVNLKFQPMFTAFELEVGTTAESTTLTKFTMTSPSKALSGRYVGTVTASTTTGESTIEYTKLPTSNPSSNGVEVNFGTGVTIQKGHHIKFTVFVIPHEFEINSSGGLTLEFTTSDDTKTMTLKTTTGTKTFAANKKFNLKAIELPSFNLSTVSALADYTEPAEPVFSVSATKTVKFTKGNLYWDGSTSLFHIESNQTAYPTTWSTNHVGHFFWSKTASVAYASKYSDDVSTTDTFFFGQGNELSVDGQSGLYALSSDEWTYLLTSTTAGGRGDGDSKFKNGVTVNGFANCLVIAPDGYTGTIASSYDATAWAKAEASGLVCLPAAGHRTEPGGGGGNKPRLTQAATNLVDAGSYGRYLSSTPATYQYNALHLYFDSSSVDPAHSLARSYGCSVRLVY